MESKKRESAECDGEGRHKAVLLPLVEVLLLSMRSKSEAGVTSLFVFVSADAWDRTTSSRVDL